MTHKRNTKGLLKSVQNKRDATLKRAEKTIKALVKAKKPINFTSVAETANVSKAWLYREISIADRIRRIRDQQQPVRIPPPKESQRASVASKDAIIIALKERIKKIESENRELRKQLEVAYGQIHSFTE